MHDVLHGINGIKMATIIESQATTMTPMADVRGGMLPPISRDEVPETSHSSSSSLNNNSTSNSNNNSLYVHVSFGILFFTSSCTGSCDVVLKARPSPQRSRPWP